MAKAKASPNVVVKRKSIRFDADPLAFATISLPSSAGSKTFKAETIAAIIEESQRGCGLLLKLNTKIEKGTICLVKIGNLTELKSEVRWRVDLDDQCMRIGISYLE